jgi:hypothetical protein
VPTVFVIGPYRFFFYSADRGEPPHVHIERDDDVAKIWLHDLSFARQSGFSTRELKQMLDIARDRREELLEAWNAYFGA